MRRDEFLLSLKSHTGWILFSGQESTEESGDPRSFKLVSLLSFIREDPSLGSLIDSPIGTEWTRSADELIWRQIVNGQVVDETGRIISTPHETLLRSKRGK
jgi:hypothetical protein